VATAAQSRAAATVPAQSITLFVLPAAAQPPGLRTGTNAPPDQLELWLDGQAGTSYTMLSSSALSGWLPISTNLLTSNSFRFLVSTTNSAQKFYRCQQTSP